VDCTQDINFHEKKKSASRFTKELGVAQDFFVKWKNKGEIPYPNVEMSSYFYK